jgi:dTDP-4-dehydrorhamnose 3,5-epimerase
LKFLETPIPGLYVVELEVLSDERGFFARSFCVREFRALGLELKVVAQCNISFNEKAGTLRGLHFQAPPHEEAKLVRCTRGAIYDVAVDIRPGSRTYRKWHAVELTADNRRMMFIPHGLAHGFQTLVDGTEVFYLMSEFYHPESGRGLRWDDPAIEITWPLGSPIISDRDRAYPLLDSRSK